MNYAVYDLDLTIYGIMFNLRSKKTLVSPRAVCRPRKRVAARRLIERYYVQLTDGCGRPDCDNEACASSGERFTFSDLSPDGAAVAAIDLLKRQARLCGASKVARSDATTTTTAAAATTGVAETGTSGDGQSTSQGSGATFFVFSARRSL